MPPTVRSGFAWFVLLCAAIAVLAVIHWARTFSQSYFVTVLDSDTLACADGRVIRLIGIAETGDGPGAFASTPADDPGRVYLKGLLEGQAVRIKPVKAPKDARGRISAYVYLGEVLVNGRMIKDGYAMADPRRGYPEQELFEAYESEARLKGLGIWKSVHERPGTGP
ncbi:MAG: thermonuclease family protein [Syntrophaceae bacterium]